jgi:DNA (cytosine-5)-methyltransferase 1
MTTFDYSHLPQDPDGRYRSERLPSMRGECIRLDSKVEEESGLERWQQRLHDEKSLIVLDLFCGAGGLSLGFQGAGFFTAAGVDAEPWAAMSHSYNFLSKSVVRDISSIDDPALFVRELGLPRVDVIIGGPPCQGFARIGRGKLRSIEREAYYSEVLNNLYREFVRFVEILKPMAFVMENVPDMALYDEGKLLEKIKGSFPRYAVDHRILDAVHYGVPQRRKRLFVQGNRLGLKVVWPKLTVAQRFVTVKDAISDLPVRTPPSLEEVLPYRPESQTEYQVLMRKKVLPEHREVIFDHIIRQVREDDKMIFNLLPQGGKYRDLPKDLQRYRTDIFDDKYWRLINSEPSWTVTAHIRKDAYRYIHPDQCRTLSIREFARLQSFPDHFRFAGPRTERLRQIGNAVPPLLAERIATSLYHQLITKRAWDRRRAQPDSMLQEVRTVEIEASQEPLEFELVYGSETL